LIIAAIVFNPVLPVGLGRNLWKLVDLGTAFFTFGWRRRCCERVMMAMEIREILKIDEMRTRVVVMKLLRSCVLVVLAMFLLGPRNFFSVNSSEAGFQRWF
jgi:hypothetical protein